MKGMKSGSSGEHDPPDCMKSLLKKLLKDFQLGCIANDQEDTETQQQHDSGLHDAFLEALR
jgi:hypothetical protein